MKAYNNHSPKLQFGADVVILDGNELMNIRNCTVRKKEENAMDVLKIHLIFDGMFSPKT